MAYGDVTALGTEFEWDTTDATQGIGFAYLGSGKALAATRGAGLDGFMYVLSVDGDGAWSSGTGVEIADATTTVNWAACKIDSTHAFVAYADNVADGWCFVAGISGTTPSVLQTGGPLEWQTDRGEIPFPVLLDSDHVLIVYQGAAADGFAQTIDIDTANDNTWQCATFGTALEFDTADNSRASAVLFDSDASYWYVLIAWRSTSLCKSCVVRVEKSTGTVTKVGSDRNAPTFEGFNAVSNYVALIDSTHVAIAYHTNPSIGSFRTYIETLSVATDGTMTLIDTSNFIFSLGPGDRTLIQLDGEIWLTSVRAGSDCDVAVWEIDPSTYIVTDITVHQQVAAGDDSTVAAACPMIVLDVDRAAAAYIGPGNDGFVRSFDIDVTPPAASTFIPRTIII